MFDVVVEVALRIGAHAVVEVALGLHLLHLHVGGVLDARSVQLRMDSAAEGRVGGSVVCDLVIRRCGAVS